METITLGDFEKEAPKHLVVTKKIYPHDHQCTLYGSNISQYFYLMDMNNGVVFKMKLYFGHPEVFHIYDTYSTYIVIEQEITYSILYISVKDGVLHPKIIDEFNTGEYYDVSFLNNNAFVLKCIRTYNKKLHAIQDGNPKENKDLCLATLYTVTCTYKGDDQAKLMETTNLKELCRD